MQVKQFLDATTHEVVVIDFHSFTANFNEHVNELVVKEILKYLRPYLAMNIQEHGYNVTMGDLWKDNKRLVIGYKADFRSKVRFFPAVRHLWANAQSVASLNFFFSNSTCSNKTDSEVTSIMAELTATPWTLLFDTNRSDIRKMAQGVNYLVSRWFAERWWRWSNFIASDFFLGNNLIELAIQTNAIRTVPVCDATRENRTSLR